ncbi:MAG TPA: hypothetical protein VFT45_15470 [Longimicrobium sp.]|nr:hypothetical protein [Longimicrobium sp.]
MNVTAGISSVPLPRLRTRVDEVLPTGCLAEAEAAFGRGEMEDDYRFPAGKLSRELRWPASSPGTAWRCALVTGRVANGSPQSHPRARRLVEPPPRRRWKGGL